MEQGIIAALMGVGLLALVLYMRSPDPPRTPTTSRHTRTEFGRKPRAVATGKWVSSVSPWEKKVLQQMRGDQARLERTLASKQQKHPKASREELLELIHYEHVRDNR